MSKIKVEIEVNPQGYNNKYQKYQIISAAVREVGTRIGEERSVGSISFNVSGDAEFELEEIEE